MKRLAVTPVLALLLLAGCGKSVAVSTSDANLTRVAKALDEISVAANEATKTVISLRALGSVTADEQRVIFGVIRKIVDADDKGVAIVRSISKLEAADRASLTRVLAPVFKEFEDAVASGLLGVKNESSKAKIQTYLTTISAAISVVELALEIRR